MDIPYLFHQYEEGRAEAKEYPNFGTWPIPIKKKRKSTFIIRYGLYQERRHLRPLATPIRKKPCKQIRRILTKWHRQPLNLPVVCEEDAAAVDRAVSFIQSKQPVDHAPRNSKAMNVMVELQPGHTLCFTREDDCTVNDIKLEIEARKGTPCRVQSLRHRGRPVKDGQTLGEIAKGQTDLHLLLFEGQLRGGAPPKSKPKETHAPKSKGKETQAPKSKGKETQGQGEETAAIMHDLNEVFAKNNLSAQDREKLVTQLLEQKSKHGSVSVDPPVTDTSLEQPLEGTYTNLEYLHKHLSGISFFDGEPKSESHNFCLRYIFGRKGKRANELENKITFLYLYDKEATVFGNPERKLIWSDVIQMHTEQWAYQLHDDLKKGWTISNTVVLANGKVMEFGLAAIKKGSTVNVTSLPLNDLEKAKKKSDNTVVILLVDDSVVQSNVKGHFGTLKDDKCNINFEGTSPKPYHAQLSMTKGSVTVSWGDLMKRRNLRKPQPLKGNVSKCQPRKFLKPSESVSYGEGEMLDCGESGDEGQLLDPCHEFKLCTDAADSGFFIQKFAFELMRFACGCLNTRKNGTIHFGIADEDPEKAANYDRLPCEIVGLSVTDKDKVQYKDKLTEYVNNCFHLDNREFARKCISKPQFISVSSSSANAAVERYVIEIDIEPSYEYTHGKNFLVALPSLSGKKNQQVHQFYIRNGSQISMLPDINNESHRDDIIRMDKKRLQEEKLGKKFPINMTRQLHNMLGEDLGRLDNSFKRILVLSSMEQSHTPDFLEKSTFLGNVPWSFVIDFNQATKSETGLCQKLTENTDFEIHDANDFNDEKLSTSAIPPAWVFGNGMGEGNPPLPWGKWQSTRRYTGLDELIKKARKEFPEHRTVIFFVIKQGFTKVEAKTYGMFVRHFHENSVSFYIEDEQTKSEWMDYVVNQNEFIDEHTLLRRGIVGLPWDEFKQEIENLTTDSQKGMIKIPLNEHMLCPIEHGYFNDRSVQIMNSTECDQLYEVSERDHIRYCQQKREKEKQFYSGQEVSMENLWFTENGAKHVLERDIMSRLDACLKSALLIDPDLTHGVETIRLFCSRVSGGTTVARKFLWKLFHKMPPLRYQARCCIINCIKPETVATIYNYWNYKNKSRLPVVALVDDMQDSDFDYLVKGVSDRISGARSFFKGIAIMFLRVVSSSHPKDEARERDPNMCLYMDCNLSIKERIQFEEKYADMKKEYGAGFDEFAEKTLPSFIMMMQESQADKEAYATRTVRSALPDVNENEKNMLTFLSLIQISVPDDSYIYIASFDPIMSSISFRRENYQLNWTKNLNENAKMFLRFKELAVSDDTYNETEPGVTVLCSVFAEAILQWINVNYQKTICDIALDFMNSAAFPSVAEVQKRNECLRCLYSKMYLALQKKKKQTKSGEKRQIFSKLMSIILQIEINVPKKVNLDKALDVMKLGFEKMDHPVLAQQVARLSYKYGSMLRNERQSYFEEAEKWIQKALQKERNSYFLDTAGRIHLCKLKVYFPQEMGTKHLKLDSSVDCLKAVGLCLDSVKWFQESQRAEQLNPAGYYGEMDAMHYLLSILANSAIFQYAPDNVRKYICFDQWVPKQIPWTGEQERNLKKFRERYSYCLMKVEEIKSILKIEDGIDVLEFEARFQDYFVYFNEENQTNDLAKWRQNWMFIQGHIGGGIFRNVFNINLTNNRSTKNPENAKDLCSIREKLKKNLCLDVQDSLKHKDALCLIIVKMALYSPFSLPPLPKEPAIAEFLETRENMQTLLQMEERTDGKFKSYCLLFSFMFQWPHYKSQKPYDVNWEQKYHETLEKLETMSNNFQQRCPKPDIDTGEEFARRQRLKQTPRYTSVVTLFYLGKGQGLDMYVHVNELLLETARSRSRMEGNRINWGDPYIGKRLKCLSGERISKSEIEFTAADKKTLTIRVSAPWQDRFSLEPVSFYVGFSWKGPHAYGVVIKK